MNWGSMGDEEATGRLAFVLGDRRRGGRKICVKRENRIVFAPRSDGDGPKTLKFKPYISKKR